VKLVIIGAGELADIAKCYLTRAPYHWEIAGYAAEKEYIKDTARGNLPIVPLEDIGKLTDQWVFNAVSQLDARVRLFNKLKTRFQFANYVSPKSTIDPTALLGDGVFVFEGNNIQYKAKVGHNVVLWSGNHIGHQAVIGNHCFIASHVVVSGFTKLGARCYVGVNACFADKITVGEGAVIGMGTVVIKDLEGGHTYVGNPARLLK
jgi:sugar O-acyltransferase (sialic acid O-acetyltransferase NeuD family)